MKKKSDELDENNEKDVPVMVKQAN